MNLFAEPILNLFAEFYSELINKTDFELILNWTYVNLCKLILQK